MKKVFYYKENKIINQTIDEDKKKYTILMQSTELTGFKVRFKF